MDPRGRARVLIVLHAHLPYVRIPGERFPLQELWLYQNMHECYLPLIRMLSSLVSDRLDFSITLSLSPTLLAMLADEYYREKFRYYLLSLRELYMKIQPAGNEKMREARDYFERKTGDILGWYDSLGGDLIAGFRHLAESGKVRLITTAATHALLPAFRFSGELIHRQIDIGLGEFERYFGSRPRGFWLPEMGYYTGLDGILRDSGIMHTFLEAHSVYLGSEIPSRGNFFPPVSPAGVRIFPRELLLSNAIWATMGYPRDESYREFHYDYTYSVEGRDLADAGVERIPFGLKLYRVTGGTRPKDYYRPDEARSVILAHADDFLARIRARAEEVLGVTGVPPVFTLPFDAELFGHWWHEGPDFLREIISRIAGSDDIALVSPESFQDDKDVEVIEPSESSWGRNATFETWLGSGTMGAYTGIALLHQRLNNIPGEEASRLTDQALKEILLAQSSDWTFLIATDSSSDYGRMRLEEHITAAERLISSSEKKVADEAFLSERESLYPLFTGATRTT